MIFNKNQQGFTLIELLIALAIISIIGIAVVMTVFQVFDINARSSSRMIAIKQVQSAGYWISHDARMAQQEPDIVWVDGQLESITLTWVDWDSGNVHQVVYTILEGGRLQRSHSVNEEPSESIVAKNINFTDCQYASGALTLTITATIVTGSKVASETREYEIIPRPDL